MLGQYDMPQRASAASLDHSELSEWPDWWYGSSLQSRPRRPRFLGVWGPRQVVVVECRLKIGWDQRVLEDEGIVLVGHFRCVGLERRAALKLTHVQGVTKSGSLKKKACPACSALVSQPASS